jgi:hypothetical protein
MKYVSYPHYAVFVFPVLRRLPQLQSFTFRSYTYSDNFVFQQKHLHPYDNNNGQYWEVEIAQTAMWLNQPPSESTGICLSGLLTSHLVPKSRMVSYNCTAAHVFMEQ